MAILKRASDAIVVLIFLLALGQSTLAQPATQLWKTETVAIAKVGEQANGTPFLRRIVLGVIAPVPTATNEESIGRCINVAFNGGNGGENLGSKFRRDLDEAYAKWDSWKSLAPDKEVLEKYQEAVKLYSQEETNRQNAYVEVINAVKDAVQTIDQVFRGRLVERAECSGLSDTSYLTLVQRVCPAAPANCGAILGTERATPLLVGNKYVNRFEALMAWSRVTQGADKSLQVPHTPVLLGPGARTDAAQQALLGFKDNGYSGGDPIVLPPKPDEAQKALEQLIINAQKQHVELKGRISSSIFAVIVLPREVGIRLAELGVTNHPQFGLTQLKETPGASFQILSDEVARSRIFNCVHLLGITNRDLVKLASCSGYELKDAELTNCLQQKSCRPLIKLSTRATKEIQGTSQKLQDLQDLTLYPRFRVDNLRLDTLAELSSKECSAFFGKSETDPDLTKCLLTKALGKDERNRLANCLLATRSTNGAASSLNEVQIQAAISCYATENVSISNKAADAKMRLDCLMSKTNTALQSCLLNIQLPPEQKKAWDCFNQKPDVDSRLECVLAGRSSVQAAAISACAAKPSTKLECLQKLLPANAQNAIAIGQACGTSANGAAYLSCAKAMGLPIDPKVAGAVECGQQGSSWARVAVCVAGKNVDGPIGQIAACVSDGQAVGAGAIAACVAGNALGFNEDMQMLTQCAVASGGEPTSTATCTFGKLTLREMANCTGKHFGDEKCFGDGNTLRVALGIGPNSTVAQMINVQLDYVNGAIAFTQKPGETVEATLRNAGHELTIVGNNIYRTVEKAGDSVREQLSTAVGGGVYVKIDSHHIDVGPVHIGL